VTEFLTFLVAGIVTGAIYAVTASGLVVTYNITGVFNFAQGAMGMVLAFLFWQFWQGWGWPMLLSLGLVLLVCAPLMGAVIEWSMMRRLRNASTGVAIVVTVGLLLLLFGIANTVWPQTVTRVLPSFLPNVSITVAGVAISGEQLVTIAVAIGVAVLLRLFFKLARSGLAMRAVVDDVELAVLHGAPARRISSYAWMIGAFLAGLAGILLAPQANMNILQLTVLVVYGYAAAVVGRLRSLPLTVLGAMVLGVANSMAIGYAPSSAVSYITAALPMALLLLALVVLPDARLRVGRVVRPRPPRVASVGQSALGSTVIVLGSIVLAMTLGGTSLDTLGDVLVLAVLGCSLVPLSGYGGQSSLCQYTFLGMGAFAMASVGGGHSVLGVLAAVGMCATCGALLALPALRLRGIYLALATLAFAVLMDDLFFSSSAIMGPEGTLSVGRPWIFGMHFESTRSFVILVSIVLALCLFGVGALRRSSFGRRLVAMNDSPAACATSGLNLTATKLVVFALSAGLAGLAGALYGGMQGSVSTAQFAFPLSLVFFLAMMFGGISTLSGPLVAGIFVAVVPVLANDLSVSQLLYLGAGVGAISIGFVPNGLAQVWTDLGTAWRTRRQAAIAGSTDRLAGSNLEGEVTQVA
jgi:branched-chain amino acid transport system permease protein